jgi:hypothetical protein
MRTLFGFAAMIFASWACAAAPLECTAASGERRVPLLELYTSEGCDSCPPTDRWLSELPARGFRSDRIAVLAYHVDYWDYIGWRDPYAQRRFSERQRYANARNGARSIYTPQVMLDGRDFRRGRDDLGARLADSSRGPAQASIRLAMTPQATRVSVSGGWSPANGAGARQGEAWLALYENNLATDVRAGENRGKRLQHDFVVRDLAGPFPAGTFTHAFAIDPKWKPRDLGVVAFVHDVRSGAALQALTLPYCPLS